MPTADLENIEGTKQQFLERTAPMIGGLAALVARRLDPRLADADGAT
jgi:hypothetical protein